MALMVESGFVRGRKDAAFLPMRAALGTTMVYHGLSKLKEEGREKGAQSFSELGIKPGKAWVIATGVAEVPSEEVGLSILGPLRNLDEVAYLRFASVYQAFSSVDDFEKAITDLRAEHRKHGP